ncbi:polysaccharide deacetylase family protein [Streptomyces liangshanensis]|uniref:polysaccharide deacetylase family protein n=1 Tax=Streptomyces liangshanensis TaxID=2717324 RepID=UPI0036D8597B
MQLLRQKREFGHVRALMAALLVAALASGCGGESAEAKYARPGAATGHPAPQGAPQGPQAQKPGQAQKPDQARKAPQGGPAGALAAYAENLRRAEALRTVAARRWKLARTPLTAPPPPAVKPVIRTRKGFEVSGGATLPPVFTTVPVKDKVVFLTIDDGAEKDPEFLRMMSELKIPYSAFLSDYVINDDYGYFARMRDRGVALHNHTLHHRYLPGLSYAEQKREICGQQDKMQKRYGKRPRLFRPPYGNYNGDTLRVAGSCGVTAVPLWAAEAFPDHMEWREWDRDLHPGDIVLTHFRGRDDWKGSMPDMVRRVMKTITDKGYAVARLEDYV